MRARMSKRTSGLLLAGLMVLAVGCTVEDTDSSEGTPPPGDLFAEVLLDEYTIEMPETMPGGTVSFEISNTGDEEHSFAIEGPGVEEELPEPLDPTETTVLTLELAPGTYTVWCPIGDHRDRGMEMVIEVTEPTGSPDGAPLDGLEPTEQEEPVEEP